MPLDRTLEQIKREGISNAFLPGRNLVFLSLACAEASGIGASEVWIGVNTLDFSGYPDCRPDFVEAFKSTARIAMPRGPEIVAPLLNLSKPEIAKEAASLGLQEGDTWSCYKPDFSSAGIRPCGRCDACVLHRHAWSKVG